MRTDGDLPDRPLDLTQLLATLADHRVEFLILGGIAVQVHGHRRTTKDLDLMPAPEPSNYERLAAALAALDAHPRGQPRAAVDVSPTDPERLRRAAIVPPLTTTHGEVHILNDVKGAAPYPQLRARALELELDGIALAIVGLDDLIRMKRATGRSRDLDDVAALIATTGDG